MPKPSAIFRVNKGIIWNGRVKLLGLSLLLILSVSFAALCFVARKVPSRDQTASTRAGWYFSSGQWRADVRTLVAAFEYVIDWASGTPAATSAPTNQLASPPHLQVKWNVVPNFEMFLEALHHQARNGRICQGPVIRTAVAFHLPMVMWSSGNGKRNQTAIPKYITKNNIILSSFSI